MNSSTATLNEISSILIRMDDPFEMFPLAGVARLLSALVEDCDEEMLRRSGPYGVSRKYWDVPTEQAYAQVGLLAGAGLVLGQAALSQTVSGLSAIRRLSGGNVIPETKFQILRWQVEVDSALDLTVLEMIDIGANYFKHYPEWPADWNQAHPIGVPARTIAGAKRMGLSPGDLTDNLNQALRCCGASNWKLDKLATDIQAWRERVVARLKASFGLGDR